MKECAISGCGRTSIARDLCARHYQQFRKSSAWNRTQPNAGDPLRYLTDHMFDGCCTPWPFARQKGYAWVWDCGARIGSAHTIVCERVNGPRPSPEHVARHLCGKGDDGCFNAQCLQWGTPKDNYDDAVRHGTAPIGSRVGTAKLNASDVYAIRALRGQIAQTKIAAQFGVSQSLISAIMKNQWWKHVAEGSAAQ